MSWANSENDSGEDTVSSGLSSGTVRRLEETELLNSHRIFLLMKKEYRLSRNTRAHWYFSHLNTVIQVQNRQELTDFTGDIEVVAVMPEEPVPAEWDWDTGHLYKYQVTSSSMVTFLSRKYRLVYMLDISPSAATTDIKKGCVLLEQMIKSLRRSLEGVIRPFNVPGCQLLFRPDIYVTVIAWTPFLCPGAQSVLHQGWLVTTENIEKFMDGVTKGIQTLEEHISNFAAIVIDELETIKLHSERIVGDLFEENMHSGPLVPSIPMAAPDTGFVNMIQTGMLALQLLPDNSSPCIIIITDGVTSVPDIHILDALLNQLRSKSICLSFLQVSSSYHPHTGFGYCPYNELMQFMSLATSGAYLPRVPEIRIEPSEPYLYEMNIYHEAFLAWSFRKCLEGIQMNQHIVQSDKDLLRKGRFSEIRNPFFTAASEEQLIFNKRLEMTVNTNLTSILSCRLREGYTVNSVGLSDTEMKVKLTLPWRHHTFVHYIVSSAWPPNSRPEWSRCRVEVCIEGPYDIVFDIVCQPNKQFPSHYRTAVIKKFAQTLQHLNQTDKLLVHLNSFTSSPSHYTLPETIRNGLPLFTISPGTPMPVLYSTDTPPTFHNFWRPICSLDINIWHRWMHTHRIGLLLQHDHPLPKYLVTCSSTGRYHPVLCRKAASKVSELLKNWTEFCLLENHSYISFIRDEQGQPNSFYVVRVTSKPPCLVVWLAFLGGILGSVRHKIVTELNEKIRELTIRQRLCSKDLPNSKIKPAVSETEDDEEPAVGGLDRDVKISPSNVKPTPSSQFSEVYACKLLSKPVERILVRYENLPTDYCSLIGPFPRRSTSPVGGVESPQKIQSKNASAAFLTLSRYLSHKRWIWSLQNSPNSPIPAQAVSRILNTLCKMRLHEGFTFSHSSKGIQNMVLEVPMKPDHEKDRTSSQNCVLQYLIFPPHFTNSNMGESLSEGDSSIDPIKDTDSTESSGEIQIVTELWTEPQDGISSPVDPCSQHLAGKLSREFPSTFHPKDLECISTLITFEHLYMMCENPSVPSPITDTLGLPPVSCLMDSPNKSDTPGLAFPKKSTIEFVPFAFDLLSLLPKSHQTEMIFSLFLQDLGHSFTTSPFPMHSGFKAVSDQPNEMLFEGILKDMANVSDREVCLNNKDYRELPDLIRKRQNTGFQFPLKVEQSPAPLKTRETNSFSSSYLASHRITESYSQRYPSGTSNNSSMADAHRDLYNHHDSSDGEGFAAVPKWKCFTKAVSPTHLIFTLIPASYQDLKKLTLNDDILSGGCPDIVDIIKKTFPTQCNEIIANLDEVSINSSIPNLESVPLKEMASKQSPRLEPQPFVSRQRSGSDVFEMNRPKLPPMRKTSGDLSVMRDRTTSLDGYSQFKAKALLLKNRLKEANDRNPCEERNNGTEPIPTRRRKLLSNLSREEDTINSCESLKTSSPLLIQPLKQVVGSLSLPVYIYDCSVSRLTNGLLFGEKADKPKNFHLNYLFRPEVGQQPKGHVNIGGFCRDEHREMDQKTPEPEITDHPESHDQGASMDRDVRQWCQVMKMIFFKSFVTVLFRCLQLKLPIHKYDVQHAVEYCDNESPYDLELDKFIKAVCPHFVLPHNTETENQKNGKSGVLNIDRIRNTTSCVKSDSLQKTFQKKFESIIGQKFKAVPSHPDLFFFCPPGLELESVIPPSMARRRNETKSSESTSKQNNSRDNKEDDDRTIEFRSNVSSSSIKLQKQDSLVETDIETGQGELRSNMSSASNFDNDWESEDGETAGEADDLSPPLFVQLTFSISQDGEDIVSVPIHRLPSCLSQILQDKTIPDPEQDLNLETLGLRLDIVCMTLPRDLNTITDNIGTLRSTSLCSTLSYRDSHSMDDDDIVSLSGCDIEVVSTSDILSHLPAYQHKAVSDIKDELNWMLMDEIAFAHCKNYPLSHQTLDFVSKHVQASSRERSGSMIVSLDLEFVFGPDKSMEKFKEMFSKIKVRDCILRQVEEFYYFDKESVSEDGQASSQQVAEESGGSSGKRKCSRVPRHLQLSPVKESLPYQSSHEGEAEDEEGGYRGIGGHPEDSQRQLPVEPEDYICASSESSDKSEFQDMEIDLGIAEERFSLLSNLQLVLKVEKERVLLFLHFRETTEEAIKNLQGIKMDLAEVVKNICVKVNQDLLLKDLHDTRICNRLLEPESNEDAWRDRHQSMDIDDSFEEPYLEANMNVEWVPGRFQCPEVWRTTFALHPRLKLSQGHGSQSSGMQAIKAFLSVYMVSNRTDMFVYMDDQKNIFYIKVSENLHSAYTHNIAIRQTSLATRDEEVVSRTSSIGSSKQLKRTVNEDISSGATSRSNSVGESDRNKQEDQIIVKVYGIEEAGKNIKEDLTAVLQKKLDDKVVEVISMMLKRNSRTKLSSEDVLFLQRPLSPPTSVIQFTVHVNTIQYLPAVAFYLRQNMVHIPPLIVPNYTTGNSKRFKDFGPSDELSIGKDGQQKDNDVFLYNDHNDRGGRNGIACISLSIVDGAGNIVKHCHYPTPTADASHAFGVTPDYTDLIHTELYECGADGPRSPGPGPIALVQFRIWESGRVDLKKLNNLVEGSIKNALWDAVLEYKLLPEPLAIKASFYPEDDRSGTKSVTIKKAANTKGNKLSLKRLSQEALLAYGSMIDATKSTSPSIPQIVVEGKEASEVLGSPVSEHPEPPTDHELGKKGVLSDIYQFGVWNWFQIGTEIEVPSYQQHVVRLTAKHCSQIILQELLTLFQSTVADFDFRVFQQVEGTMGNGEKRTFFCPKTKDRQYRGRKPMEEYIIVGRQFSMWKATVGQGLRNPNFSYIKKSYVKHLQNFPPLLLPPGGEAHLFYSPITTLAATPGYSGHKSPMFAPQTPDSPMPGVTVQGKDVAGVSGLQSTGENPVEAFVPRQRLLIAKVDKTEMTLCFYNLSRDCVDRLISKSSILGQWFVARSSLLTSLVTQKLGLFHNQNFFRPEMKSLSRYIGDHTQAEALATHHSPPPPGSSSSLVAVGGPRPRSLQRSDVAEVLKNCRLAWPVKSRKPLDKDALGFTGKQMLNAWSSESKYYQHKLYTLWQSRGENSNEVYTEDIIAHFKQKSRLLHYVFTPLLFLPEWRWDANSTRDQRTEPTTAAATGSQKSQHIPSPSTSDKVPHHSSSNAAVVSSGAKKKTRSISIVSSSSSIGPTKIKSPSRSFVSYRKDEAFHKDVIANYFQEYIQYLQTLGFNVVDICPTTAINEMSARTGRSVSIDKPTAEQRQKQRRSTTTIGGHIRSRVKTVYLQKSLLGGIFIFEIGISQPFFYTKLHALEAHRLQPKSNQNPNSKNFTTTFLEQCDKIKILIHLHSFTYDYHLRTIGNYVAKKPSQLRKGFHVVSFMEDFMKYYSKGPNFARNFITSGSLHLVSQSVSPTQLYDYLLSHEKHYGMEVIKMEPVVPDSDSQDNEHILIQISNYKVTYRDHQEAHRVDDFDVSLVISHDVPPDVPPDAEKNVLSLKYFVMMTSRRELYPMKLDPMLLGNERKLGSFRPVTVSGKKLPANRLGPPQVMLRKISTLPLIQALLPDQSEIVEMPGGEIPDGENTEISLSNTLQSQIIGRLSGIRKESVNYVGFYSAHEETMKRIIQSQAKMAEENMTVQVRDAMVDCRRDQLWHRLMSGWPPLSYSEFVHLTTLVVHETLEELDPRLTPLLNKPPSWYQNLAKLMSTKYSALSRQFNSSDNQIQHTVVLNESNMGTFALVSIDLSTKEGILAIVYREPRHSSKQASLMPFNYGLIEGFVELVCFHLWTQML